jgi:hypothetical protein
MTLFWIALITWFVVGFLAAIAFGKSIQKSDRAEKEMEVEIIKGLEEISSLLRPQAD